MTMSDLHFPVTGPWVCACGDRGGSCRRLLNAGDTSARGREEEAKGGDGRGGADKKGNPGASRDTGCHGAKGRARIGSPGWCLVPEAMQSGRTRAWTRSRAGPMPDDPGARWEWAGGRGGAEAAEAVSTQRLTIGAVTGGGRQGTRSRKGMGQGGWFCGGEVCVCSRARLERLQKPAAKIHLQTGGEKGHPGGDRDAS